MDLCWTGLRAQWMRAQDLHKSIGMEATMENKNQSKKSGLADKVGDFVEKVGHKISEAGAPGIGQKIHDLGDKLEKSHKNPEHPHKVWVVWFLSRHSKPGHVPGFF